MNQSTNLNPLGAITKSETIYIILQILSDVKLYVAIWGQVTILRYIELKNLFDNIVEHYLPWWFDCISGIKAVIENIISYWFTLRDIFFIILGILVGIFIYRVWIGKSITKVEKALIKTGDILKIIYKTILNLTIKPLIICAVFVCIFITCIGTYALISISYKFLGFFIPTIVIIISVILSIVIFKVRKGKRIDKRGIFRFLEDIFF